MLTNEWNIQVAAVNNYIGNNDSDNVYYDSEAKITYITSVNYI